jgi:hypothetical protein
MSNPFHSARLTFRRAKFHIDYFNSMFRDFVDSRPWQYVVDRESEPGNDIHKIIFRGEIPEFRPCVLFDAANNLRAVLDQVGYAASIASGHNNPKKCKFPFGDTLPAIMGHVAGGRNSFEDLPKDIFDFFILFRPYKGGNDVLWAMNKLCNTKKHCHLSKLGLCNALSNFIAEVPNTTKIGHRVDENGIIRGWDGDKRELTLVTVPSGLDPHIRGHFTFDIQIDGFDVFAGKHASNMLSDMNREVERILSGTEAECRRLGFTGLAH